MIPARPRLRAVVALLISWPTFRLRGPFFAIATLAFNEVAFVLANYWRPLTGGPRGLHDPVSRPASAQHDLPRALEIRAC